MGSESPIELLKQTVKFSTDFRHWQNVDFTLKRLLIKIVFFEIFLALIKISELNTVMHKAFNSFMTEVPIKKQINGLASI